MNRTLIRAAALAATVAFASAQGPLDKGDSDSQGTPCHPCVAPGSCAPVDPLTSAGDFSCQNHAYHVHRREVLAGSDFSSASFGHADLRGSEFYGCAFHHARFYRADLSFAMFALCDADFVVMHDATLANADFSMSSFRHAYFVGADLTGARLTADFAFADLRQAELTGAVLSVGPDLTDFCNADLSGAIGLADTIGIALYSPCTDFTGTGFDPVDAGWMLVPGAEIGERYCSPAAENSTGNAAELYVYGCGDLAYGSLELRAICLPGNEYGLFLCSQTQDATRQPGSGGVLCLGGDIGSYVAHVQNTGLNGELVLRVDVNEVPKGLGSGFAPGETWNFQAWFRDRAWNGKTFVRTSAFTDAVAVTFD